MASNHKTRNDPESAFSYAVRELRRADEAPELGVATEPLKATDEHRGVDPYNTSGSFDRKRNWMRVGKR
jgi:hypothetical protein